MATYEGYCVKCREKRSFDGSEVELANGRRAAQGHEPIDPGALVRPGDGAGEQPRAH